MLNIAQDSAWVCFALLMMVYFSVPWYIVGVPILFNIGMFLIGAVMARNSYKEIPRTNDVVLDYTNNVKEIDHMLYTIAHQNPEEIQ
jgi:Kef-type K+ transport system membrane component KefB